MKVLIADDSPTTRFTLRKNLADWGYEVIEACDGDEAWKALLGPNPPRIAIIDWVMPGIEGVEICRRLSGRLGGPLIYTILLTAKTEREELIYALENGAHNFQSKPIAPEELRSHVAVGKRLVEADDKLKEYTAQMELLATIDSLTGVFNRRHFLTLADKEFRRALRYGRDLSVLMIDVDYFKKINDTHGHAIGDQALCAVTLACTKGLRENDLFGRLGGEEFCAVLPETTTQNAQFVAERLRKAVEDEKVVSVHGQVMLAVSIGVSSLLPGETTIEGVLRRADNALYTAKDQGRNRVATQ
ncbi:MAG: diguanylate cyclase [Myxococcota bacterium]|jgi:diguanylate cyclase (GGDEF)-like protein|nr:diguanylate cyclase [Myxococcota bacterium]